jgi:hypothetical protein
MDNGMMAGPSGSPKSKHNQQIAWHGLTIKEILEKVDLFNISTSDEEKDDDEETYEVSESPDIVGIAQ